MIQTEVGIARRSGTVYSYEYNLTDHLGNVRYTFNKNSSTGAITRVQSDDYYPFGLRKSTGSPVSLNNKYLYNGKELQEEFGQYDYGARFYDPVVGRWNVVDPLAEDYDEFSPYNYTLNNPTNNTDPDGMSVDTPVDIRNDYHFDADGKLNKVVIKPGPDHFYQTDKEGKTSELNSKQLTPDMAGQYLYSSGSLSQDGTLLNEVIINGRRQTSPLPKPTLIEFPSYAGGKALFSGIPRMLELGVDIMRGSENLSQLLVYMKG